eukprot:461868-Pyramimonas_sp.AAC.2
MTKDSQQTPDARASKALHCDGQLGKWFREDEVFWVQHLHVVVLPLEHLQPLARDIRIVG